MKDFFGNKIELDQYVLVLEHTRTSSMLTVAVVVGFTEKMVKVKNLKDSEVFRRFPSDIAIQDAEMVSLYLLKRKK